MVGTENVKMHNNLVGKMSINYQVAGSNDRAVIELWQEHRQR
jgi:hypothetical protein